MGRHGWNSGARRWRFTALIGVGVAAIALVLTMCTALPGRDGTVGRDDNAGTTTDGDKVHGTPVPPSGAPKPALGWGFTHTQYSADEGEAAALRRAEETLSARPLPQIQHIMGWGAENPEPSPGRYRFDELDSRVDLIRRTRGTPVITLCCAPDWMKGGKAGAENTDWSREALETAPRPEHYEDFAKLAGTVARRYPDVRHFIVWNEFKGFFDDSRRRWNHEGYTELYNLVYAELKRVNKENLVGGPYLVMDSYEPRDKTYASALKGPWGSVDQRVLDSYTYWNEHKKGADFVVIDGASYTRHDELLPDEFRATEKLTAVSEWIGDRSGGLPVWWAEYYVEPGDDDDDRHGWSETRRTAVHASGLMAMARGGASTAFYWNPQNRGDAECAGCLWRPTQLPDGGGGLPMMKLLARFAGEFPPGTRYDGSVPVAADDARHIRVLADDRTVLVVNTLGRPVRTKVDGKSLDLKGYEVRWLER
ncbi:xylan 1,4-beta-xylosidase [Streptomyces agglomeratus]|uniref:Xylan 1,4-beta-xylosidase n=1 Tax=Streptomyces agglomeratus TaxID=285458 RepID=A0A1E5PDQ5_9ACTN|nr:xylan 1,4-beta-xylosidase [Streptomyces agglomeratus]OEJ27625.1 xylan 1,4-beta-xylosidase [Streptomyces agglomeratus]OEJ38315.1 xylan 1,4-beta-xylosidase [Streptomyces agglomeratus]OEJ47301.1 xylan 1,4-beta-xylosidase [Streptomyces agglomeratus]OEJ50843.1 xylan 1,4-beta-xylosidase [Streptomyces agglomeratus]OEJ58206.1 xylan 1,4-beta-xylosidase [Streptomyces agglomeratus]